LINKGALKLLANSRYAPKGIDELKMGWLHDFNRVSVALNVPPGWTLLTAVGVDVDNGWLAKCNLWDIFFVLTNVAEFPIHKLVLGGDG